MRGARTAADAVEGRAERATKAKVVVQHARKSDARTRQREAFMAEGARRRKTRRAAACLESVVWGRGKAGIRVSLHARDQWHLSG